MPALRRDSRMFALTAGAVLLAAALAACGSSGSSNTSTDTSPPTVPTNLVATAASSTQIDLSWTASSDNVGVAGYDVERCQGASCSNFMQIATPSGTSFDDTGLTPSTSYNYRVRAGDAAGNLSAFSNTASASTQAPQGVVPTVSIVAPNNGPATGGTAVTITGTNFAAGATVAFGEAAAMNVVVVNGTKITATTPAGSAGAVTVTVTVNDQSGSQFSGFTYTASQAEPTLVQHVSCPNSSAPGGGGNPQSSTPLYSCPLPEPTQSGNAILVGVTSYNGGAPYSVSDDKGNSYATINSVVDSNQAFTAIYVATNVAAGTRMIHLQGNNSQAGNAAMTVSEYYNVASSSAVDTSACTADANSTTITSGSITPTVAGDLLWQVAYNASGGGSEPGAVTSFTAGSQSNITWQLNGTDVLDGSAVQAGVYGSTVAINPTFTSGTSQQFDSCTMALKAAAAGNAPTQAFRIVHMLHEQADASGIISTVQFPTSGNLIVVSFVGGGDSISGITSSPSNTWSSTGALAGGVNFTASSQIYYAANAASSNAMSLSVMRSGSLTQDTFMMYDFVGAATSPFDVDSGGQGGNQTNEVNSFTTCSSCVTPSAVNELIVGNAGWNFCTATDVTAPSGGLFDAATYTGTDLNGPQSVDQNNGWFHLYDSGSSAITTTWSESCNQAEAAWAGRTAAFKAATMEPAKITVTPNP
jgi:chitodextrinase